MISKDIIRLASNTSNVGLKNEYSHKISLKNSTCGDKITLELIADKKKISSMKYETISCVYCEASACLLYTSPSPRDKRQSRMPSSA